MNDLKFAWRQLSRHPGPSLIVIATLALGIGAITTVFSWVTGVLLDPIHGVAEPGRLVTIESVGADGNLISSSYPDFQDFRDQATSVAGVIAFVDRPLSFGPDDAARRVWAELVSGNFFEVLGVRPVAGRFFNAEEQEETPGKHPVVVLSEGFWERQLQRDPAAIGQTILLNGQSFTVIGIAPRAFTGTIVGLTFDIWAPVMMQRALTGAGDWTANRHSRGLHLMARLKPGVALARARSEIETIAANLGAAHPDSNQNVGVAVLPVDQAPYGAQSRIGSLLRVLFGVGGVVLLIVCANVANLLLARAVERRAEYGIRMALGASSGRLLRQGVAESLILTLAAGALGVALAYLAKDLLGAFIPSTHLPIALRFPINGSVLLFSLGVASVMALLLGVLPALRARRNRRADALRDGDRGGAAGRRAHGLQDLFVVVEVALALVTLLGAGLFLGSFQNARAVDPGFRPANILLMSLNLSEYGYDAAAGRDFLRRAQERLASLPGVAAASIAEDVPLGFDGGSWQTVAIDGYQPQPGETMNLFRNPVAPGYFGLMRIPLVEGREFTARDDVDAPPVIIVNESFARRFFGERSALGHTVRAMGREWSVVGVARDIKYVSLDEPALPYFYWPLAQVYQPALGLALHLKTNGEPATLLNAARRELQAIDPRIQVFESLTLSEYISAAWFGQKFAAALLSVLGMLALVLAAVGLFSVMAYAVSQRTHEIGIRIALGARTSDVMRWALGRGVKLTLTGIVAGIAASLALAPVIANQLLGVRATDPRVFMAGSALLLATAIIACWLPARRAARIDPMRALREE